MRCVACRNKADDRSVNSRLKGIVQAKREALAERLKLRERKFIRGAVRAVKGHVAVKHPIPPDTIADARKEIFDDHEARADVRIGTDAIPQHRKAWVLSQVGAQMMDIRVVDNADWNQCHGALEAQPAREPVFDRSSDPDRMPLRRIGDDGNGAAD